MKILLATSSLLMIAGVFCDVDETTTPNEPPVYATPRIDFHYIRKHFYPQQEHDRPTPETTKHPNRTPFTPRLGMGMGIGFINKSKLHKKHHNFHNHDYSLEVSYDSAEWVCNNQRTGDMMIIAEDNDIYYPDDKKHFTHPHHRKFYPDPENTEKPGPNGEDASTEKFVFPDNDNDPTESNNGEGLIDIRSAPSDE